MLLQRLRLEYVEDSRIADFIMQVTQPVGVFGLPLLSHVEKADDSYNDGCFSSTMPYNPRLAEVVGGAILSKNPSNKLRQRWESRYPKSVDMVRMMSRYGYELPRPDELQQAARRISTILSTETH